MNTEQYIPLPEVADILGLTRQNLHYHVRLGRVDHEWRGGCIYIPKTEVKALLPKVKRFGTSALSRREPTR